MYKCLYINLEELALEGDGLMKVKVVPAVGGGSPIELEVMPSTTVGAIRAKVCAMKKLPPDTTRLTFRGRALKDTETLQDIGAQDGDKLVLITRTVGGFNCVCGAP